MNILSMEEIFDISKPIIGVVHLKPLPGSPNYNFDFEDVIDFALKDAKSLEDGGVDGLIVENFWDSPYHIRVRNPLTVAAMSLIVKEISKEVNIPIGVNVLRNSAIEAAAISYVSGATFIRVNVYNETIVTDSGIIQPIAPKLLRYISAHRIRIGVFADINVKHGAPLAPRDLIDVAHDALFRGKASAIIVTGKRTGVPPDASTLKALKNKNIKPVLIGSGLNLSNLDLLKFADGAIIGTYFKKDGVIQNQVDKKRVEKLMNKVKEFR